MIFLVFFIDPDKKAELSQPVRNKVPTDSAQYWVFAKLKWQIPSDDNNMFFMNKY